MNFCNRLKNGYNWTKENNGKVLVGGFITYSVVNIGYNVVRLGMGLEPISAIDTENVVELFSSLDFGIVTGVPSLVGIVDSVRNKNRLGNEK